MLKINKNTTAHLIKVAYYACFHSVSRGAFIHQSKQPKVRCHLKDSNDKIQK